MKYTNDMKYKHLLRRIQEELNKPTSINSEACDLDDIVCNIVWQVEGSNMSFDDMVEESMELERINS